MMKSVAALALVASASAFAPAPAARQATSLSAFEAELGVQPPVGFFDPLGLLDGADQERFDRLRYVEIKHGRIASEWRDHYYHYLCCATIRVARAGETRSAGRRGRGRGGRG